MKVGKNQNPSLFVAATCWNLSYKSCNLKKKKSSKSGESGPFLSMKNPLYSLKSYFSGQILAPKKKSKNKIKSHHTC